MVAVTGLGLVFRLNAVEPVELVIWTSTLELPAPVAFLMAPVVASMLAPENAAPTTTPDGVVGQPVRFSENGVRPATEPCAVKELTGTSGRVTATLPAAALLTVQVEDST